MKESKKYLKVYTVEIDRIAAENKRWYYYHKGEVYNCILVVKQESDAIVLRANFLVIEKKDGEFACPTVVRTIRPMDCTVLAEAVIENKGLYDLTAVFGGKGGERIIMNGKMPGQLKKAI
jgi:hypothetical protein